MGWALLTGAILAEVTGTLALRASVGGRRAWLAVVGVAYAAAFVLLALTLRHGVGIGVAYGIWTAGGVALTALGSRVLFDEPLTPLMWTGIALIAAGVLLVELGAQ
ncbi:SMR family transporter [uncultured Georgenia sp.]|uniref:DMT family transporter n=1 Tax=uncultured Georgenia sp. TaxID=378209 RepID=UPI0026326522|nr:SMR family transporter [uncultured Georgenia sp.]HLV03902.1 SMR family transporter [Actinomycetaceae bacterium]